MPLPLLPSPSPLPRVRRALIGTAVAGSLLAASACSAGTDGGDTIRVAHVCGGINTATVATGAGTFPDDVTVEKICFDGGSEAVQALISGGVDLFIGSTEHVVSTRANGLDVRAYAALTRSVPYSLVTHSGSGVTDLDGLSGETVAVTSQGSLSDTELHKAASDAGVEYDALNVIPAGSGASMTAAIRDGGAAAGMVSEPQLSEMLRSGDFELLWEPDFDYAALVVLAREEWAHDRPDALSAFLTGLRTAEDSWRDDASFAVDALADEGFDVDDTILGDAVDKTLGITPEGLRIDASVYQDTVDLLDEVGRLEDADVASFEESFDFSPLDAL